MMEASQIAGISGSGRGVSGVSQDFDLLGLADLFAFTGEKKEDHIQQF